MQVEAAISFGHSIALIVVVFLSLLLLLLSYGFDIWSLDCWPDRFMVLMYHQVLKSNINRTLWHCWWSKVKLLVPVIIFLHVKFFIDLICDFFVFSFPLLVTWLLFKLSAITQLGPVLSQMQSNCLAMDFYLSCCFVTLMYTSEMKGIEFCWKFAVVCLEFIQNRFNRLQLILC